MGVLQNPKTKHIDRLPLPTTWTTGVAQGAQGAFVVLELETPAGEQTYFFEPDDVLSLVEMLRSSARSAKGKGSIIVPENETVRRIIGNGGKT